MGGEGRNTVGRGIWKLRWRSCWLSWKGRVSFVFDKSVLPGYNACKVVQEVYGCFTTTQA